MEKGLDTGILNGHSLSSKNKIYWGRSLERPQYDEGATQPVALGTVYDKKNYKTRNPQNDQAEIHTAAPDPPTISDVWRHCRHLPGTRMQPFCSKLGLVWGYQWPMPLTWPLVHLSGFCFCWVRGPGVGRGLGQPGPRPWIRVGMIGWPPACSLLPDGTDAFAAPRVAALGWCGRPRLFQHLRHPKPHASVRGSRRRSGANYCSRP